MFSRNLIEYGLQQFVRKSGEIAWKQTRTLAGYATCSCTRSRSKSLADNACKTLKTPASRLYIVTRQKSTESDEDKSKCKKEVNYDELKSLLEENHIQLFDVREPRELEETGKIHPKAVNIPLTKLKESLKSAERFLQEFKIVCPNKKENIIFYGFADVKSLAALEIAYKMGYTNAKHYPGGWREWSQKSQV